MDSACPSCEFVARSGAGLAAHVRARHPQQERGTNRAAIEVTLSELDRLGRLEKIDAARVQLLRSLADAVDADWTNAQLWKQYREALADAGGEDDSDTDDLIKRLHGATPVGDPSTS